MAPKDIKVAALVVTYNRKALLVECLDAILAQEFIPATIVVVDNASTDGTDTLFAEGGELTSIPGLHYFRMAENLGGAGGFKEGVKRCMEAGCDWIWLMDDDCIAKPDTLSELVSALPAAGKLGGEVSFLASSVYGPAGEPMNVPGVDMRPTANGYADWYAGLADGLVEIELATFVSLLINARAVEMLGLPVGSFFIWGDDTEYTTRLTHNYGPAYMVGKSTVLHKRTNAKRLDIQNESDPARIANFHLLYRNSLIVQRYHYGKKSSARCVLGFFRHALRCLRSGDGGAKVRRARARAVLTGIFEYLSGRYDLEDLRSQAVPEATASGGGFQGLTSSSHR